VKRLLRGIIDFEDGKLTQEALVSNFKRLRRSGIEWWTPIDEKLFSFVKEFADTNLEAPTAQTVRDYFAASGNIEADERLKDLQASPPYARKQYEHLLTQLHEGQNRDKMRALLKETDEIVHKGLVIKEGKEEVRHQGVKDALIHFNHKAHELIPPDPNALTRGELRGDVEAGWLEYQEAKTTGKAWGKFTGINEIDKVCHGCKAGQMWVHAAFTSELKSTFAFNWCYNLVTRYRTNVLYVCLEMTYIEVRRIIYTIHSANKKWKAMGYEPLDLDKVETGELTDEEEAFYQIVLKDFHENPEHCKFEVWCPDREVTIADIKVEAELKHKDIEVGFVVIDHGELVEPRHHSSSRTVELNSVLRDAKKMALHFDGGASVALLMLFQLNRNGKDDADKNEGRYKLRALSYANEAERSADQVTTTYLNDDHRRNGTTLFGHLKNRSGRMFDPFPASVAFTCRRIFNFDPAFSGSTDMSIDDADAELDLI